MDDCGSETEQGNACWIDSISKILESNKPKRKRTLVLSRAKKLSKIRKSDHNSESDVKVGFEIIRPDGEIVKEEVKTEDVGKKRMKTSRGRRIPTGIRLKPTALDLNYERSLRKTATKGVVQLFNAVKQQQYEFNKKFEESGQSEGKKDNILRNFDKNSFLDLLMSGQQPPQ